MCQTGVVYAEKLREHGGFNESSALLLSRNVPGFKTGRSKTYHMGEDELRLCYAESRKHCIQRHDVQERDTTSLMHLDLEHWMLTLIKA